MKLFSERSPAQFQEAALRAIAESPESAGIRFLATLVPLNEPILELIANPIAFDHEGAKRIVEVMRRIDPQTEAKLLRLISGNPAKPLSPEMTDRILDIIDELTDSPRLVPVLMQVFRLANPYLRARLALSIGKHHRNKDWIEDRMRDGDPRVRANAVEANWHQKDEQAITLFQNAVRDQHHRVIGNGAVGLYYAGDLRALRVFGELIHSGNAKRRSAGVWGVGHVLDSRFRPILAEVAKTEEDYAVRRSLIVAEGRLDRVIEIQNQKPKLQLRLIKSTRQSQPPEFKSHLFIEVRKSAGGPALHGLKALQFQISENDEVILDYSVQERTSYVKQGAYDIYFTTAGRPANTDGAPALARHLQINIITASACGEYDSYDFGEIAAAAGPAAETEPAHNWDAFR